MTEPERAVLANLYDQLAEPLRYDLILKLHGDEAAAEDILSEAFEKLALALALGRGYEVEHASGLLRRIAFNLFLDYYRRERARPDFPAGLAGDMEHLMQVRWLDQNMAAFPDDFDSAMRGLEDADRHAFILTELRGLPSREAAPLLDACHMTVQRRADRARRTLREDLT